MFCSICNTERKTTLLVAGHGGSSFKMIPCSHVVNYKQNSATVWYDENGKEVKKNEIHD